MEGNMFVYLPGSGFTGEATLVKPCDELFTYNYAKYEESPNMGQLDLINKDVDVKCTVTKDELGRY